MYRNPPLWPVRFTPVPPLTDPGDPPPRGWCPGCGQEIYRIGYPLCRSCFDLRKEYEKYELSQTKPLSNLHPGTTSRSLRK